VTTPPTILIIDDNVNLARGFAAALGRAGYAVHVATTAERGLELAHVLRPQGIILDFQMPFVNGTGFLYRLREVPALSETPVLVVTGITVTDETLGDLHDLGARLRFKPLGLRDLILETDALITGDAGTRLNYNNGRLCAPHRN
jgi:DNA-binding response OmpR family regulator